MDKETSRKAKDFLARRDVVRPIPVFPPEITPAHFPPGMFPPESFPHYSSSATLPRDRTTFEAGGETPNKARKDQEEKNNQIPGSDLAARGSVTGDTQDNTPKGKRISFRDAFDKISKELDAMDKKERDAKFPTTYTSDNGCSAEVAFQYLMDEFGSI